MRRNVNDVKVKFTKLVVNVAKTTENLKEEAMEYSSFFQHLNWNTRNKKKFYMGIHQLQEEADKKTGMSIESLEHKADNMRIKQFFHQAGRGKNLEMLKTFLRMLISI